MASLFWLLSYILPILATIRKTEAWNAAYITQTAMPQDAIQVESPKPTQTPLKRAAQLQRRQTIDLSTCGYLNQVPYNIFTCSSGFDCVVSTKTALSTNAYVSNNAYVGCCSANGSPNCGLYTGCVNYFASSVITGSLISCVSSAPYCQYYTFPEVDASAFGCGLTQNQNFQTILLLSNQSTSSLTANGTTSSFPGTSTTLTTLASSAPSASPKGSNSIQDLTTAQKGGIGAGCGVVAIITGYCLFLYCFKKHPDETLDASQVVEKPGSNDIVDSSTLGKVIASSEVHVTPKSYQIQGRKTF